MIGFNSACCFANSSAFSSSVRYSALMYSSPKPNTGSANSERNFPLKSTNGTRFPCSSFTNKGGTPASAATLASSAPKVGAVCTIPVPSSVVTKSPGIIRNASSGRSSGSAYGMSCSYFKPTKSVPVTVFSIWYGIFFAPAS